jgi:hypothetical protein
MRVWVLCDPVCVCGPCVCVCAFVATVCAPVPRTGLAWKVSGSPKDYPVADWRGTGWDGERERFYGPSDSQSQDVMVFNEIVAAALLPRGAMPADVEGGYLIVLNNIEK